MSSKALSTRFDTLPESNLSAFSAVSATLYKDMASIGGISIQIGRIDASLHDFTPRFAALWSAEDKSFQHLVNRSS